MCLFFKSARVLTHHDSSNADANVPNDVEFIVEEILDAGLTILQNGEEMSGVSQCLKRRKQQELEVDLTLAPGLGAGQGLASVPQQFS